uniref:Uncharacterized protein n=1 Tax=Lepeophtheirus salmonis TaxID=72036 RepID=A0A0K2T2X0_LEPSM
MSEIVDPRYALRKRIRASVEGALQRCDEREQRTRRSRCRRQFCSVCEDFISGTQNEVMKHMDTCIRVPSSDVKRDPHLMSMNGLDNDVFVPLDFLKEETLDLLLLNRETKMKY